MWRRRRSTPQRRARDLRRSAAHHARLAGAPVDPLVRVRTRPVGTCRTRRWARAAARSMAHQARTIVARMHSTRCPVGDHAHEESMPPLPSGCTPVVGRPAPTVPHSDLGIETLCRCGSRTYVSAMEHESRESTPALPIRFACVEGFPDAHGSGTTPCGVVSCSDRESRVSPTGILCVSFPPFAATAPVMGKGIGGKGCSAATSAHALFCAGAPGPLDLSTVELSIPPSPLPTRSVAPAATTREIVSTSPTGSGGDRARPDAVAGRPGSPAGRDAVLGPAAPDTPEPWRSGCQGRGRHRIGPRRYQGPCAWHIGHRAVWWAYPG